MMRGTFHRWLRGVALAAILSGGCTDLIAAPAGETASTGSCNDDPSLCRMAITSNQVFALRSGNLNPASSSAIAMKYDLVADPASKNAIDPWHAGADATGTTAYDMTRSNGPLGSNGSLGFAGPLGSLGPLSQRFAGSIPPNPAQNYGNNWCAAAPTQSDSGCVYGSYGPLGQDGPLNPAYYFNQMYHLEQHIYWHGDYNHNLDSSGVWGIQGPLGPTGPLAAPGALGPLGISLQAGMTTTEDGVYQADGATVRKTQPIRYTHDATVYRIYDLFEMYSKAYATKMGTGCADCEENDTSFAVDASLQPVAPDGDAYYFTSGYEQFVSINVVPVNFFTAYGMALSVSANGGSGYTPVATANSNPFSSGFSGIMNFIVARVKKGEKFRLIVNLLYTGIASDPGYFLYVSGSGVTEIDNKLVNDNPDIWGPRLQNNGTYRFNINGAHQAWNPW